MKCKAVRGIVFSGVQGRKEQFQCPECKAEKRQFSVQCKEKKKAVCKFDYNCGRIFVLFWQSSSSLLLSSSPSFNMMAIMSFLIRCQVDQNVVLLKVYLYFDIVILPCLLGTFLQLKLFFKDLVLIYLFSLTLLTHYILIILIFFLSCVLQFDQIEDFFVADGSRKLMFFYQECTVSNLKCGREGQYHFHVLNVVRDWYKTYAASYNSQL